MHFLGLFGMYFNTVVVKVKTFLILFRLALAILWPQTYSCKWANYYCTSEAGWICKKWLNPLSSVHQDLVGYLILTASPWSILTWITLVDRLVRLASCNSQICMCSWSFRHTLRPAVSTDVNYMSGQILEPPFEISVFTLVCPLLSFLFIFFLLTMFWKFQTCSLFSNTIGHHTIKLSLWEQVIMDNQLEILQICLVMNKTLFLIMIKLVMSKGMVKRLVDIEEMEKKFSILNWWNLCFAYWLSRHNKDTLPRILKDNTFNSVWVKVSEYKWVICICN